MYFLTYLCLVPQRFLNPTSLHFRLDDLLKNENERSFATATHTGIVDIRIFLFLVHYCVAPEYVALNCWFFREKLCHKQDRSLAFFQSPYSRFFSWLLSLFHFVYFCVFSHVLVPLICLYVGLCSTHMLENHVNSVKLASNNRFIPNSFCRRKYRSTVFQFYFV